MKLIKFLQVNLHHAKGASAVLSRRFKKEGLDMALLQEPWSNKGKILGIQIQKCKLFYDENQSSPRTAILVNNTMKCYPITEFIKRDIVAVVVEVPTSRGKTEIIVASAYFPGDVPEVPSPEISSFIRYCREVNKSFIIGCDANAHHTVWGSTDINGRGECLLEFLSSNGIDICNKGNKPTFLNAIREEVLDLTLCNSAISEKIRNWHVSDETSLSDHKHIVFEWGGGDLSPTAYRNPRKTNWGHYANHLKSDTFTNEISIKTIQQLESFSQEVNEVILKAYNNSCPIRQSSSSRDVPWWNSKLESLRKTSRKLFNKAKRTSDWAQYRRALTEYNNELRKSKRRTWIHMCESIDNTPIVARLQKTLAKNHTSELGNLKRQDGVYTKTCNETLDLMMDTHFPGAASGEDIQYTGVQGGSMQTIPEVCSIENPTPDKADKIFTFARVENAVRSFSSLINLQVWTEYFQHYFKTEKRF